MRRLLRAIDVICLGAANVAAALAVGMALLGISEIVLRAVFRYGLPFALEYGTYALCLVMFAGGGWALRHSGHIRVELLVALLPPAARRAVDIAVTVFALAICVYLSVAIFRYALATYEFGTVSIHISHTPLAYPQFLFALGVCTLPLALLARLIRILLNEAPEETAPVVAEEGM